MMSLIKCKLEQIVLLLLQNFYVLFQIKVQLNVTMDWT